MKIYLVSEGIAETWTKHACENLGIEYIHKKFAAANTMTEKDLKDVNECYFQLIYGGEFYIQPSIFNGIEIPKIFYMLDTCERHPDLIKWIYPQLDYMFYAQKDNLFYSNKSSWLAMGVDLKLYDNGNFELTEEEKNHYQTDVLFIGTYNHPKREPFAKELYKYNSKIVGNNWEGVGLKNFAASALYGTELGKRIRASKICLQLHYSHHDKIEEEHGIASKVFEMMAMGGAVLCDRVQGFNDCFKENFDILGYSSMNELHAKIEHYLNYPEELEEIKKNAAQSAQKKHTNEQRFLQMINTLRSKRILGKNVVL